MVESFIILKVNLKKSQEHSDSGIEQKSKKKIGQSLAGRSQNR